MEAEAVSAREQRENQREDAGYSLERVPETLLKAKEDAYLPQLVSVGPPHELRLCHLTHARAYKHKCAAILGDQTLSQIKQKLSQLPDITLFYAGFGPFSAQAMAEDCIFLLFFLNHLCAASKEKSGEPNFGFLEAGLKCDIVKLENQLPLCALRLSFQEASARADLHASFENFLVKSLIKLSPFPFHETREMALKEMAIAASKQKHHLLGLLHSAMKDLLAVKENTAVSSEEKPSFFQKMLNQLDFGVACVMGLCIPHPVRHHRDFLDRYNAESLQKAGVKFKSFSKDPLRIHFNRKTDTLYLPRINVSHNYTEVLLRNLMALEFNEELVKNSAERPVTTYVELMDCLLDTAEDVRILRECHAVHRESLMLRDEDMLEMWDGMCRPFFTGRIKAPEVLKETLEEVLTKKYYRSRLRVMCCEFYKTYLSRPWSVVGLIVAVTLVVADLIQTYCALHPSGQADK